MTELEFGKLKSLKLKISTPYYYLIFAWSLLGTLNSALNDDVPVIMSINTMVWYLIRVYIIIKILFELKKYKLKDFILILAIFLIAYFSTTYSQSTFLTGAFWFIAGARNINWKRVLKMLFVAQLSAMIFIFLAFFMGIAEDNLNTKDAGVGHSWGYSHANALAACVFQICCLWLYIKQKFRVRTALLLFVLGTAVYMVTLSGTSSALIWFLAAMVLLFALLRGGGTLSRILTKQLTRILEIIVVIVAAASIVFSFRSDLGESLLGDFHTRITLMGIYFAYYKILPWGQPLMDHYSADYDYATQLYTLDNAYLHMLLGLGYIVFIIFMVLYIRMIWRAVREKDYMLLVILVAYVILGFTETMFIRVSYNFTILLIGKMLWERKRSYTEHPVLKGDPAGNNTA